MNVQTSTLDGFNNQYIPPDTADRVPGDGTCRSIRRGGQGWSPTTLHAENGPFTPQMAMAESINTAYTDLWHVVAGGAARRRGPDGAGCSA
jgi:hypothetical protein